MSAFPPALVNTPPPPLTKLHLDLSPGFIQTLLNEVNFEDKRSGHIMLYGHNSGVSIDSKWLSVADKIVQQSLPRLAGAKRETTILSVRLLVSPSGTAAQTWHLDYARHKRPNGKKLENQTIFVNLTESTIDNCTELLRFEDEESVRDWAQEQANQKRDVVIDSPVTDSRFVPLNEAEPCEIAGFPGFVYRAAYPAGSAFHIPTSEVFHRRGANHSDNTRVTLNIDFAYGTDIGDFVCVDSQSASQGALCDDDNISDSYDIDLV